MWIRVQDTKHADFDSADAARTKWLTKNQAGVDAGTDKVRIKRRPNGTYNLITWHRELPATLTPARKGASKQN